jgi:aminoglycoside 2'-N-acetyltransferase I
MIRNEAGDLVCHLGMQEREAVWNGAKVRIGGIGGVATRGDTRGQGLASRALETAMETWRGEGAADFALLFTEPHNIDFYDKCGWRRFEGDVIVDQPGGRIKHTMVTPFVHDLTLAPREGMIDLCGKPW